MTSLLLSAIFLYLLIKSLSGISFYLYLWQLKEYRLDRFLSHLKTIEGRKQIFRAFNPLSLELKRPKLTLKSLTLFFLGLVANFHYFFVFWQFFFDHLKNYDKKLIFSSLFSLLTLNLLNFIFISFLVVLFSLPTLSVKKLLVYLAKKKLQKFPQLLVIGITGSFGKTTVKEMLFTLLSSRYPVLKTSQSYNTEIAIAQTILGQLKPQHQIFIVEMGAYRTGEIQSLCRFLNPQIGILTGINSQHQSLFGSLEKTIAAKSELINSLPANGLAIFNADNHYCLKIGQKTKINKLFYSLKQKTDVFANQIQIDKEKTSFNLNIGRQAVPVTMSLPGQSAIQNFLAASTAANHLQIHPQEIAKLAAKIKPINGKMFLIHKKNLLIIDDSFNSNPDGFQNALEYLSLYHHEKKIVLTPGMIELGQNSASIHQRLGENIGQKADVLILTSHNYQKPLFAGALKSGMKKNQLIFRQNPEKIYQFLKKQSPSPLVLLVEGRIPDKIKKIIFKELF